MQIKRSFILFFLLGLYLFLACSEKPPNLIKAPINPNGDSELALLMRLMYEDAFKLKSVIQNNETLVVSNFYEEIYSAIATEKGIQNKSEFIHFAKNMEKCLKSLGDANDNERLSYFNKYINNCMGCHQAMCPGPMVKIKKLYIK